jgi:hypothetical protein
MIHRIRLLVVTLLGMGLASCNMPLSDDQISGTLALTPSQINETPSQTTEAPPKMPGQISGKVWHDLCAAPSRDQTAPEEPPEGCILDNGTYKADGLYDQNEPGINDVIVTLGRGSCPSTGFAESASYSDGVFGFFDLEPGQYCVSVDPLHPQNNQILPPGKWTSNLGFSGVVHAMTVNLESNGVISNLEFGWDYQFLPPYSPIPTATQEPTEILPTSTPNQTPQITATPATIDPDLPTWDADYVDHMNIPGNWFASGVSSVDDDHVRFEIADGKMTMTAFTPDLYEGWRLSWPDVEDFYLESLFEVGECSGRDRYGLFLRGTNITENPNGYLFGVTCDGQYSLRSFDGEFTILIDWTSSDHIFSGSNQTNQLGFWAKGDQLRLYVNGERLGEIQDDTFDAGPFGLFVGSAETEDLSVVALDIAYWLLP